jgi:gluconolactonase
VILVSDLGLPEAPVLLPDGGWLLTEMAPDRGCVTRVDADGGNRSVVARTGRPNGLALDDAGVVWVAESQRPSLLRLTLDGKHDVACTSSDGRDFVWPNDVAIGPDGAVYMTDSGILIADFVDEAGAIVAHWADLAIDGCVCRFDPRSGRSTTLDDGYRFTNGLAFDAEGRLYVNETMTGNVYRYTLRDGEVQGERELFGNVLDPEWGGEGIRGPDGMKFSADGRVYCTVFGQGDVTVLGPDGGCERRIRTRGSAPTNVAFDRPGARRIVVTDCQFGELEVFDVGVDGLPLHAKVTA